MKRRYYEDDGAAGSGESTAPAGCRSSALRAHQAAELGTWKNGADEGERHDGGAWGLKEADLAGAPATDITGEHGPGADADAEDDTQQADAEADLAATASEAKPETEPEPVAAAPAAKTEAEEALELLAAQLGITDTSPAKIKEALGLATSSE